MRSPAYGLDALLESRTTVAIWSPCMCSAVVSAATSGVAVKCRGTRCRARERGEIRHGGAVALHHRDRALDAVRTAELGRIGRAGVHHTRVQPARVRRTSGISAPAGRLRLTSSQAVGLGDGPPPLRGEGVGVIPDAVRQQRVRHQLREGVQPHHRAEQRRQDGVGPRVLGEDPDVELEVSTPRRAARALPANPHSMSAGQTTSAAASSGPRGSRCSWAA